MITAHIKSPFGNRDEEWQDAQIGADFTAFIDEYQVYALGYPDEQQQEKLGIVSHSYWEMQEEIGAFSRDLATPYPRLVEFTRQTLGQFGQFFKQYNDMEQPLLARTSITPEQYAEMETALKVIRDKNTELYVQLMPVMAIIAKREQTDETKLAVRSLLQSLYDFSNQFYNSTLSMSLVLKGLLIRASGGEYTPLQYLQELGDLQKAAEARREVEKTLTAARTRFLEYFPPGQSVYAVNQTATEPLSDQPAEPQSSTSSSENT